MSPYVVVAGVVLAGLLLFVAAMAARRLLAPSAPTPEKLTTYECGVDPVGQGWAQTHVRYYVYAFLYVVFAVDAVYLFPWATVFRQSGLGRATLVEMGIFLGVLPSASPMPPAAACCGGSDGRPDADSTAHADAGPGVRLAPRPLGSCSTGAGATACGSSTSAWPAARSSSSRPRWPGTTSSGSA